MSEFAVHFDKRFITLLVFTGFSIIIYFSSRISSKHNYNTRLASKSTYYIDHVRTNYGKFNLPFSGPSVWNNLDEELKRSALCLFKQAMLKNSLSAYV